MSKAGRKCCTKAAEYQEKLIVDLLTLLKQDVALAMAFVEPASKKPENTLPAD